jgi:4'-phosphopantetheinyl transferase EntD
MGELLPSSAITVEGGEGGAELLPEEKGELPRMVEKRRREFAAGRACARRALAQLGWPAFPLLSGSSREPLWPPGVVGSLTHCAGYCACAVAPASQLSSVGIDAEPNVPLPAGVEPLICTGRELASLPALPGVNWPTVLFSAKEAVYKAWFPLTHRWLDFLDAEISVQASRGPLDGLGTGLFLARLRIEVPDLLPLPGNAFEGRFKVTPTHVLAAVALVAVPPASGGPAPEGGVGRP